MYTVLKYASEDCNRYVVKMCVVTIVESGLKEALCLIFAT